MSASAYYRIYGGPASPYSYKVRALFRYRRIPHVWEVPMGGFTGEGNLGEGSKHDALRQAQKGVVPVVQYLDSTYHADSTPIMLDLESRHAGRSIIPDSPALAFIAHLLEDMADESLPLAMFYFRWMDDAKWCGRRQITGWNGPLDNATLDSYAENFMLRQQQKLGPLRDMPRESVLAIYHQFLDALEAMLAKRFFFFGSRPSLAELGLYGQLTQYNADPFVSSVLKERAVRTFQWSLFMDDLSGLADGSWDEPSQCLNEELTGLLQSLAGPYLMGIQQIEHQLSANGPAQPLPQALNGPSYRLRCFQQLQKEFYDLEEGQQALLKPILEASGCWEKLQVTAEQAALIAPISPG